MDKNFFILAGNGSDDNRGCEAISKGTVKILRNSFDDPNFLFVNFYSSKEQFQKQISSEADKSIAHKKTFFFSRKKIPRAFNKLRFFLSGPSLRAKVIYKEMIPYLENAKAVLSLGGDNYSFDYKKPVSFTDLDNLVFSKNKPMIIWGASVGPFSRDARYEEYMKQHLKKITAIFARESLTVDYLSSIGIKENVYRIADPAFVVDAAEPSKDKFDKKIPEGTIGVNLSYLMAKFVAHGNVKRWAEECAVILKKIMAETKRPVYLIPHVSGFGPSDHLFLEKVLHLAGGPSQMIDLAPDTLNFQETKWIIGKMHVFLGSRTHSVISAFSSGIPTASLVYSIKGFGINRDFYGNDNFSIGRDRMNKDIIAGKIKELIENRDSLKRQIDSELPRIKEMSFSAGEHLKNILKS